MTNGSPAPTSRRLPLAALSLAAMIGMVALASPAVSAPFTPGNLVVATAPTAAGVQPITLIEYNTNGGLVQSIPLPQGKTAGSSTTMFQINFSDVDNQLLYVATAFTNSDASTNCGYVRYNAATGTVDEFGVALGTIGTGGAARGVASIGCNVFAITGSGLNSFLAGVPSALAGNSNNRYGENFGGNLYYTAGGGTTGIHMQNANHTTDTTIVPSAVFGSSNMAGLHVPAADTIYVGVLNGAGGGVHKLKDIGGTWTDLGTNSNIPQQGNDIDSAVISGSMRTVYALGGGTAVGGNTIFKLVDDISDTNGATWQSTSVTPIVTGLIGTRSITVVPGVITPPTFMVNVTTAGSGSGTVMKSPAGPNFPQCSTVMLTATPASGSTFASWTGDVVGGTQTVNPLPVTVDTTKNIVATFNNCTGGTCKQLTLNFIGNGSVNANPPGLDYASPGPHAIVVSNNANVSLNATPASGWVFDHWSGDASGMSTSTSVVMSADRNVTAVFKQLFQLRTFFDGNGSVVVNSPSPESFTPTNPPNPLYRDGTVLNVTATAGTIGGQQAFWTFVEYHDQTLAQVGNTATANITITGLLDLTARFAETPLNVTPQPFTPGNLITGEMRDFPPSGSKGSIIQLREYNPMGRLVQPVIDINTAGYPGGYVGSALSTTAFQIAIDPLNIQRVYAAAGNVDNVLPVRVGLVRNSYCGAAHITDFSASLQVNSEGRGVAVQGNLAYFAYDGGIRRVNATTGVVTNLPNSGNARNLKIFGNALYVSTAASGAPYAAGPGVYRVDNADAGTNQVYTQIISTGASSNPIDFAFSDANHIYVGFSSGGGKNNVHKYVFNGSTWGDLGENFNLGSEFGRGLATVVNGDNVALYVMGSKAASDSHVVRIDQFLSDDDSDNWNFFDVPTEIVPEVSRGRGLVIVPSGCNLRGDLNGDYRVDGQDIQGYVNARVTPTFVQCADMDGSGAIDATDDGLFISALLSVGGNISICP